MTLCYVALGSNIEPERHLVRAAQLIRGVGRVVAASTVYETEPVGDVGQPRFLNAVLCVESEHPAGEVRAALKKIETELGRPSAGDRSGPRTIDADLVLYGDHVIEVDGRHIPSPEIEERAFVAVPLAEIAPDLKHPRSGRTMREIAARFGHSSRGMQARPDVRLMTESLNEGEGS